MNKAWSKQEFLEELRGYLSVLEDQEQEDIIGEYSQHIDMKLQKGLSEEEAVRDFGSMKELAAEILEAYHVKPEFRQRKTGVHLQELMKEKVNGSGTWFRRMGNYLKEKSVAAIRGMRAGFLWIGRKCRAFAGWLMKPYHAHKNKKADAAAWEGGEEHFTADGSGLSGQAAGQDLSGMQQKRDGMNGKERMDESGESNGRIGISGRAVIRGEEGTKDMAGRIGRCFCKAGRGIAAAWGWLLTACLWGLRLMWNAAWLMFALFCAALALVTLAGLGAMAVLLLQGYPLLGLSLITLGGILCFGSLAVWAYSMRISMRIKKKTVEKKKEDRAERQENETEPSGGEVPYE